MKTTSLPQAASHLVPVLICALAVFLLSAMDAVMKSLVIAIGVYNTVLWRSMLASLVAGGIWTAGERRLPPRKVMRVHALRVVVVAIVLILFFWGLARLPLAEGIALSFIAPLIALYLAALLLGERIRREIVWASLAGMGGVVIIMVGQFGRESYTQEAMLGTAAILASALFYAYNLVLMRQQAQIAKPIEIAFFQNLGLVVLMGAAAPWLAVELPREFWLPIAGVTALSLTGQFMMSWAYGRAEAQYLIPTEYTAFVWAIALGWVFFAEPVEWTTLAGAGLIIVGCLVAARTNPKLAEPIEATI